MRLLLPLLALLLGLSQPFAALGATFVLTMDGQQVVDPATGQPGAGHPSASVIATLVLDGPSDTASWSFSVPLDVLPITSGGIYRDTGGQADPLLIELNDLVGSGLVDADVDAVLLYPTLHYVELTNGAYPLGLVRAQLPEPGTFGLAASALAGTLLLRRRRT